MKKQPDKITAYYYRAANEQTDLLSMFFGIDTKIFSLLPCSLRGAPASRSATNLHCTLAWRL